MYATSEQAAEKVVYQVIPIPSEARKLSFVEDPRKERFSTPQTPFAMAKSEFFRKLRSPLPNYRS